MIRSRWNRRIANLMCAMSIAAAQAVCGVTPTPASTFSKTVYLTFDDGPSALYTPRILDVLREYRVPATFFVLGYRCNQYPAIVRRMRNEGHEIGNHGYDHQFILHRSETYIRKDVLKADAAILRTSGLRATYFRPPGGRVGPAERETIRKLGHPVVLWTVDSRDWESTSAQAIIQNVESAARPGSIVLFHDGVSNSRYTIQALPAIISFLRLHGYTFQCLPTEPERLP